MAIVLFETTKVYSLGYQYRIADKIISKGTSWLLVFNSKTDFLGREFPICDVPGGQLGNPLIFPKGNSPL